MRLDGSLALQHNAWLAGRSRAAWAPAAFTACVIAIWVLLAAATNTGQFADNIEQFVWAQSWESAYWKHPPLPSWLLRAAIQTFGFWSGWAYLLAALCFAGTAYFTWRIAYRLGGERVAAVAVLLQGLHLGFSQRAELYNHNTVLVLFSAMTVWAVLCALDSRRATQWILAGALGGFAVLAKYQAVIILTGIFIALALSGRLRERRTRQGCAWAVGAGLVVLSVHLAGLLHAEQTPFSYALTRSYEKGWGAVWSSLYGYAISQLRFHVPMLMAIGLAVVVARKSRGAAVRGSDAVAAPRAQARAWLIGLVAWPIAAFMVLPLATGTMLQAQWGLPAFQFLVIYVGFKLVERLPALSTSDLWLCVVLAQLCNFWVFVAAPRPADRRVDTAYPASMLAAAVQDDWQRVTACPLKFLSGPTFEAGMVSIHSAGHPLVLEDGDARKSPWIDARAMRQHGYVSLRRYEDGMVQKNEGHRPGERLAWTITPPEQHCGAGAREAQLLSAPSNF